MSEELHIAAKVENLDQVLAFLEEYLDQQGCSMRTHMQLAVAVEEIYVNIAHYAYVDNEGEGDADIRLHMDGRTLEITFIDSGIPYDPLAKPDPDVTLPVEERQIGGLGIFMVKKSMDDVKYERKDGQNILTLYKSID
ncbi:MAG: ATP-binding protein [Eubacterium sp.]|nr:ATP-binding protein [Eubacterium sp.]